MRTYYEEPIIALCTPQGAGALALFRFVGVGCIEQLEPLISLHNKRVTSVLSHSIHHAKIIDPTSKSLIDDGMVIVMKGPRTFTGQDTVEITLHNNPCIIARLYDVAQKQGFRKAEAGEFSHRAFLEGKIDLLQAEAIHELITATNEYAVDAALQQLGGSLSSYIAEISEKLLGVLVLVEASFEFLDEEQRDLNFSEQITRALHQLCSSIETVLTEHAYQQRFKEGIRIALIGSVNAGKSTLFNALVNKNRAIVSSEAGTTRDTIEMSLYQDGFFRTYIDTAGLRETAHQIEYEGIQRSWQEAHKADIVLLVVDQSTPLHTETETLYRSLFDSYHDKSLVIFTKNDLTQKIDHSFLSTNPFAVTAQNKETLESLQEAINAKIKELTAASKTAYALNERHLAHLQSVLQECKKAVDYTHDTVQPEMIAWHLKDALERLSALTGKSITEQCHDAIFRSFCVGK